MTDHWEVTVSVDDGKGGKQTGQPLNMAAANAPTPADAVKVATGILVNAPNGGAATITRGDEER